MSTQIPQQFTQSTPSLPEQLAASIHCPKCKTKNPTNAESCLQCGKNLLPDQGAGLRLFFFFFFLFLAGVFVTLMYSNFIREGAPNPESFWINPVSLSVGILVALILAFYMALRRIPIYKRYEKRSFRHQNLDIHQSIADLTSALVLAPDHAKHALLKQRRLLYEKIGDVLNANRDRLALAQSPDAWKSEGDFLSVFGGMQGDAFSWSMRRAAIDSLLTSGMAVAIGYCQECRTVVELDKNKRCPLHPKIKGSYEELVIPEDAAAGRLAVLAKVEHNHAHLAQEITRLLEADQAVALGYCPGCADVVRLDARRRCPNHPDQKIKQVVYDLPDQFEARRLQMLIEGNRKKRKSMSNTLALVMALVALITTIVYFVFLR